MGDVLAMAGLACCNCMGPSSWTSPRLCAPWRRHGVEAMLGGDIARETAALQTGRLGEVRGDRERLERRKRRERRGGSECLTAGEPLVLATSRSAKPCEKLFLKCIQVKECVSLK